MWKIFIRTKGEAKPTNQINEVVSQFFAFNLNLDMRASVSLETEVTVGAKQTPQESFDYCFIVGFNNLLRNPNYSSFSALRKTIIPKKV